MDVAGIGRCGEESLWCMSEWSAIKKHLEIMRTARLASPNFVPFEVLVGRIVSVTFWVGVVLFVGWFSLHYDWSRYWQHLHYGVPEDQTIVVNPKPHGCDWDRAPLGIKDCHYEETIMKFNEGTIDQWMLVSWHKVQDL
jgi:hypothetical protein